MALLRSAWSDHMTDWVTHRAGVDELSVDLDEVDPALGEAVPLEEGWPAQLPELGDCRLDGSRVSQV